ncbi:MAG: hypothetical protein HPY62_13580 [Bacteroidales bacterium]|nr:hypothetical protein [Bacteroidales bacterium]
MHISKYTGILISVAVLLNAFPEVNSVIHAQENFEAQYKELMAKLEKQEAEPRFPDNNDIEAYIRWMGIKAADRDNARAISLRANKAGNPYWERQFINLAEQYGLDEAKEHMKGFYATIKGKVEKENNGIRQPVAGADARYKVKDIRNLQGKVTWSSSKETTGVSITDLNEAIFNQKPFDPERDGNDYTYSIIWNLKSLN